VNLKHISARLMKPGDDNDFVAGPHSIETIRILRNYFKKGVGRPLRVKQRGVGRPFDFRSNLPDRFDDESFHASPQSPAVIGLSSIQLAGLPLAFKEFGPGTASGKL